MRYAYFGPDGRITSAHNDDTVTTLPAGAIELTDAQWGNRFHLIKMGDRLVVDPVSPTKPTFADLAHDYEKRKVLPPREQVLTRLTGIGFDADADDNAPVKLAVRAARRTIQELPNHPAVVAAKVAQNMEQLEAAYKLAYAEAVRAADPAVVTAFRSIDL